MSVVRFRHQPRCDTLWPKPLLQSPASGCNPASGFRSATEKSAFGGLPAVLAHVAAVRVHLCWSLDASGLLSFLFSVAFVVEGCDRFVTIREISVFPAVVG